MLYNYTADLTRKNAPNQADNIVIFRSCLLPKMRLSVVLEGRYIGYKGHFWSAAKVAPRFGCAKQSKNLERYLLNTYFIVLVRFEEIMALSTLVIMARSPKIINMFLQSLKAKILFSTLNTFMGQGCFCNMFMIK